MSKRTIRAAYIAIASVFVALMVVGTFFDLNISRFVSAADGNKYIVDNAFARFLETVGSSPLYLVTGFGAAFIAVKLTEFKKSALNISLSVLCAVACVFAYTMLFKASFKYVAEHADKTDAYRESIGAVWLTSSVIGAVCAAATFVIAFFLPKSARNGLFVFGLTSIIAFALSQGVVQGIKPLFSRQRYRMITFLEYRNLGEYVDYTPWYVLRGSRAIPDELSALGAVKDWYKSFPSGHSCAAAMSLCLICLADVLNLKGKKYAIVKIITVIIGVAVTVTVAYSRIVIGAHYLTDVTFGVGITVFAIIISEKIVKTLVKKIKI